MATSSNIEVVEELDFHKKEPRVGTEYENNAGITRDPEVVMNSRQQKIKDNQKLNLTKDDSTSRLQSRYGG